MVTQRIIYAVGNQEVVEITDSNAKGTSVHIVRRVYRHGRYVQHNHRSVETAKRAANSNAN